MDSQWQKAAVLVEALPYIKKFHGKTVVVKYGGNAMITPEIKNAVMRDLILMQLVGMHPVLVHGGGPEINQLLKKLDIPSRFVNGQRVTSPAVMEVVEMALAGKLNPQIVRDINLSGGNEGVNGIMLALSRKECGNNNNWFGHFSNPFFSQ